MDIGCFRLLSSSRPQSPHPPGTRTRSCGQINWVSSPPRISCSLAFCLLHLCLDTGYFCTGLTSRDPA
ncbi:hypothetical protein BJX76DRAFT_335646 [Aspergillus varians]